MNDPDLSWEMIRSRNQTAHTYNEKVAAEIADLIVSRFDELFKAFMVQMHGLKAIK